MHFNVYIFWIKILFFILQKRLEDSGKLCKELAEETNRLEQHLELEKEKRFRLEDTIGRMQEQMELQQLSTEDSVCSFIVNTLIILSQFVYIQGFFVPEQGWMAFRKIWTSLIFF